MRRLTDVDRLERFMRCLGEERGSGGRVYLTGGATAVLLGWRSTMIARGYVDRERALDLFNQIESHLYRYPAIDPVAFRRKVEDVLRRA